MRESRSTNPTYSGEHPSGSLELTIYELNNILATLKRAEDAKIRFEGALIVGAHKVHTRWKTGVDQRDGDELVITKITRS